MSFGLEDCIYYESSVFKLTCDSVKSIVVVIIIVITIVIVMVIVIISAITITIVLIIVFISVLSDIICFVFSTDCTVYGDTFSVYGNMTLACLGSPAYTDVTPAMCEAQCVTDDCRTIRYNNNLSECKTDTCTPLTNPNELIPYVGVDLYMRNCA